MPHSRPRIPSSSKRLIPGVLAPLAPYCVLTILLFSCALGAQLLTGQSDFRVTAVKFHPKEHDIFLCGGFSPEIKAWDIRTGKVRVSLIWGEREVHQEFLRDSLLCTPRVSGTGKGPMPSASLVQLSPILTFQWGVYGVLEFHVWRGTWCCDALELATGCLSASSLSAHILWVWKGVRKGPS